MAKRTLAENITKAADDLTAIKAAIEDIDGEEIEVGTPTEEYPQILTDKIDTLITDEVNTVNENFDNFKTEMKEAIEYIDDDEISGINYYSKYSNILKSKVDTLNDNLHEAESNAAVITSGLQFKQNLSFNGDYGYVQNYQVMGLEVVNSENSGDPVKIKLKPREASDGPYSGQVGLIGTKNRNTGEIKLTDDTSGSDLSHSTTYGKYGNMEVSVNDVSGDIYLLNTAGEDVTKHFAQYQLSENDIVSFSDAYSFDEWSDAYIQGEYNNQLVTARVPARQKGTLTLHVEATDVYDDGYSNGYDEGVVSGKEEAEKDYAKGIEDGSQQYEETLKDTGLPTSNFSDISNNAPSGTIYLGEDALSSSHLARLDLTKYNESTHDRLGNYLLLVPNEHTYYTTESDARYKYDKINLTQDNVKLRGQLLSFNTGYAQMDLAIDATDVYNEGQDDLKQEGYLKPSGTAKFWLDPAYYQDHRSTTFTKNVSEYEFIEVSADGIYQSGYHDATFNALETLKDTGLNGEGEFYINELKFTSESLLNKVSSGVLYIGCKEGDEHLAYYSPENTFDGGFDEGSHLGIIPNSECRWKSENPSSNDSVWMLSGKLLDVNNSTSLYPGHFKLAFDATDVYNEGRNDLKEEGYKLCEGTYTETVDSWDYTYGENLNFNVSGYGYASINIDAVWNSKTVDHFIGDGTKCITENGSYSFDELVISGTKNEAGSLYKYYNVNITDDNLLPENIKKGVTILGVTGTYEGDI